MTSSTAPRAKVSIEEYLAMEAVAETKHILWHGEVFSVVAMAGGTFDHNTLSGNVVGLLYAAFRGTQCRVMTSDQKVWVPSQEGFVYPDATVVCGRVEPYAGSRDVLANPLLIVEVLFEGTENFDRGEKFEGYRSIPSLRHYLMVSSRRVLVEHYARTENDAWLLRTYTSGETVVVQGPDASLAVDELYRMALNDDTRGG